MHIFKDPDGREWQLKLDFNAVKLVRSLINVDLLKQEDLSKVASDSVLLCDLLYCLCREQCNKREMSDVAFGEMLTECFEPAVEAYMLELVDFFQRLGRKSLATLIQKQMTTFKKMEDLVQQRIQSEKLETLLRMEMEQTLQKLDLILSDSSTVLQE